MKKYFILTVCSFLVGYYAKWDHWFEDERQVYFPGTKTQEQVFQKNEAPKRSASDSSTKYFRAE